MMKQAQQLQERMGQMQDQLNAQEFTGQAGSGVVTLTVNGRGELRQIKINPSVVDPSDVEMLEDLITAAFLDAKSKADDTIASEMKKATGGFNIPGLKLPFG